MKRHLLPGVERFLIGSALWKCNFFSFRYSWWDWRSLFQSSCKQGLPEQGAALPMTLRSCGGKTFLGAEGNLSRCALRWWICLKSDERTICSSIYFILFAVFFIGWWWILGMKELYEPYHEAKKGSSDECSNCNLARFDFLIECCISLFLILIRSRRASK